MTKPKVQFVPTICVVTLAALMWIISYGGSALAENYGDSAHGNTEGGVNRSGTGYDIGNCAHCHDTFDDTVCGVNLLMLFAPDNPTSQNDNFCFQCHKSDGAAQQVANNDYGATFGGGTAMFTSIYDAFNPSGTYASSHDLEDLQAFARGRDWGSWMTEDTNACLVCHDQHLSQKNFPVLASGDGGVKTAVRRGDDVNTFPGDLWGNESGIVGRPETMADLMSEWEMVYQAPYHGATGDPVTGPFEPAGDSTSDGSNLPNFVWACAETCHSQDIDSDTGPIAVDWTTSMHGGGAADNSPGDWGWLKPPYSDALRGSYVLSCTDCHETHGSSNATLLRTTVNGVSGLTTGDEGCNYPDGGYWYYWCQACHDLTYNPETGEGHSVIWPAARCSDNMGCHLFKTMGYDQCPGGDHGFYF